MSYAFLTFYVPYVLPDLCASGYKVYETGQERWDVCCVTSHSEGGEGVNLEEPKEWTWRNHLGSPAQPWLIPLSFRSSVCNSRSCRNKRMNKKKLPTICVCGVTVRTLPQVFSPCATSVRGLGADVTTCLHNVLYPTTCGFLSEMRTCLNVKNVMCVDSSHQKS